MSAELEIHDVPDDIIAELRRRADAAGSSEQREALAALRRGLGLSRPSECRAAALAQMRHERPRVDADIAAIIREERPD